MIYFVAADGVIEAVREYYRMGLVIPEHGVYNGCGYFLTADNERGREAVEYLLDKHPPGADDIFVHMGIVDGYSENGFHINPNPHSCSRNDENIYILNALYGNGRNESFYPEMLFKHPFTEASADANGYVDIVRRFEHHNVYFFIVYVKNGETNKRLPNDKLVGIVNGKKNPDGDTNENVKIILRWLDNRSRFSTINDEPFFTINETELINKFINDYRLTESMRIELLILVKKYKLRNGGFSHIEFPGGAPYPGKREAKAAYAKFREKLME